MPDLVDLAELRRKAQEATPGPWQVGDDTWVAGVIHADGTCSWCGSDRELVWSGQQDINGTVMEAHAHKADESWPSEHEIVSTPFPREAVAGNYGYEEGGIIRPSDADFIVAACNSAETLVEVVEVAVEALRAEVDNGWGDCMQGPSGTPSGWCCSDEDGIEVDPRSWCSGCRAAAVLFTIESRVRLPEEGK